MEIECTDCHGTPAKYPWELPLGWGDEFGLTITLIDDGGRDIRGRYSPASGSSIPNYTIIGRDFRIRDWYQAGGEANWELIDQLLAEDLPEVDWQAPENLDAIRSELGLD